MLQSMKNIPLIYILFILLPIEAMAQKGAQNNSKSIWESAGKKAGKAKTNAKGFRDRIQNWGLDTNYNHAFLLGGKLNSDGWSSNIYFVKKTNYKWNRIWQVGFSEIKHEKQTKQKGKNYPQFGNATPYVFGKINNLYTLQVGYGHEKLLLPSVLEGNTSVCIRYNVGLSLAMLKPYYLKLIYMENIGGVDTSHLEEHKYSPTDSARFLTPSTIFGSSRWSKGLGEINYIPGAYFEVAFTILPGKPKTFIQAITLGINGAFYADMLPLMANAEAYRWQASAFAGLAIGKRWR